MKSISYPQTVKKSSLLTVTTTPKENINNFKLKLNHIFISKKIFNFQFYMVLMKKNKK